MQTPRTDLFPETLLVARSGQRNYTTSRKVAQYFGKNHRDVLRAIRAYVQRTQDPVRLRNFAQSSCLNEQGKAQPEYELTKVGFMFTVMGFTGAEADEWKWQFIEAFNALEAEQADLQARYVAALDMVRPKLRPVANDFADGMTRSDTAQWLGCSVASVSYQRTQARRLGLLPAIASARVGGVQ